MDFSENVDVMFLYLNNMTWVLKTPVGTGPCLYLEKRQTRTLRTKGPYGEEGQDRRFDNIHTPLV